MIMKSLHSFPSTFLPGGSLEDALLVHLSSFFSSPVGSIQALLSISFPHFNVFFHAGAPHNHPPLAIQLFRSAQDISKIHVSTLHSLKLFRGCYIIQAI